MKRSGQGNLDTVRSKTHHVAKTTLPSTPSCAVRRTHWWNTTFTCSHEKYPPAGVRAQVDTGVNLRARTAGGVGEGEEEGKRGGKRREGEGVRGEAVVCMRERGEGGRVVGGVRGGGGVGGGRRRRRREGREERRTRAEEEGGGDLLTKKSLFSQVTAMYGRGAKKKITA